MKSPREEGVLWGPKAVASGTKAFADAITLIGEDTIEDFDSLKDSWANNETLFKDVSFGGGTYSVVVFGKNSSGEEGIDHYGLTDEERKININHAPTEVLSRLFQVKGDLSAPVAGDIARFIVDWRDTNTSQEKTNQPEDCSYLSFPSHCKNLGFEILEELFWIPGMSVSLFRSIKEDVTLYGEGRTNINTATETSLMAHGLSAEGASKIVKWREARNVFENVSWITGRAYEFELGPSDMETLAKVASSGLFGLRSSAFQGVVQAKFGERVRGQVRFIVDRNGELKSWWE